MQKYKKIYPKIVQLKADEFVNKCISYNFDIVCMLLPKIGSKI